MSVLAPHDIALEIGGKGYVGWTGVVVDRGIDSGAGSFDLTLVSKEKTDAADWPIDDGAACCIYIGKQVLITGYVDAIRRSIVSDSRGLSVRGRDKAADMVDCSAINSPGSWTNQKLETIAKALAAPFGILIHVVGDTGAAFKKFAIQPGETAFAAIERLARYRGLVLYSPGDGTLRIGGADTGKRTGQIVEGRNVKSADGTRDMSERFSQYIVKGQAAGNDNHHGKAVAQVKASATDSAVTRYRPLLIIGEEQVDAASAGKRAAWEAAVRSGRANPVNVTVPGWFTDDGTVWAPGARSACDIPSSKVSGDLLVQRVRSMRDESGSYTEMELVPPEAWTQLAEKEASS